MSTTNIAAEPEKSDLPSAHPSTTLEPTRPDEEHPERGGDPQVGDIDDLPRPDWNDAPE